MGARRSNRAVLAVILVGYLLILIDVSILMAALPQIHADLGFSPAGLSWAQNAYTLTFGGLLLLGARVGDLLGRRRAFMLGIGLFTTASLAVGLAQSPAWMIAARAVQGVGAATLAPATLALLSASFPEGPDRARAMAAYGALAGIGTAFGLIVGGVLTSTLSWRYGFLLNVPVGLAAILAAPRVLEETERHAARLDAAGALCSTLGASALVFGIVHSADAGWTADSTVAALAAGVVLLTAFVAAMLAGTLWMSRVAADTGYPLGIAVPMIVFGLGQGLGLSSLTTAGMAGVEGRDAAVAGGLVNVAHHLGGALGLGILVTVFDAAGSTTDGPQALLADRVSAALTVACLFLALALAVTLVTRTRRLGVIRAPRTAL